MEQRIAVWSGQRGERLPLDRLVGASLCNPVGVSGISDTKVVLHRISLSALDRFHSHFLSEALLCVFLAQARHFGAREHCRNHPRPMESPPVHSTVITTVLQELVGYAIGEEA